MFICIDCRHVFEDPAIEQGDLMECFGNEARDTSLCCPQCHGDFQDAIYCDICEEVIEDKYIVTVEDQTICCNCFSSHDIDD